jgi:hypothetical protein
MEEHSLRAFENKVIRNYLEVKGGKWREAGGDCIMRNFINCTLHQILTV